MDASPVDGAAAMDTTAAASAATGTEPVLTPVLALPPARTPVLGPALTAEASAEGHINGTPLPKLVDGWPQFPTVRKRYFPSPECKCFQGVSVSPPTIVRCCRGLRRRYRLAAVTPEQ